MTYHFEFRPYQRQFRQPLQTRYGSWTMRQGLILKLTDPKGRSSFGEVAPLPWFGSETYEQALEFCTQMSAYWPGADAPSILSTLPACQFGFETLAAAAHWEPSPVVLPNQSCCMLLPPGPTTLAVWPDLWERGFRVFKYKIGMAPVAAEMAHLEALLGQLPLGAKLRLDANGSLHELAARQWLDWCDRNGHRIEYLEQPLPVSEFNTLMRLSRRYHTPIALDESIASLEQLKLHFRWGWDGIYVLKASIMGSPQRLQHFCHSHPIDAVISSVFETTVGHQALIHLAIDLAATRPDGSFRALGLGTQQWFKDDWGQLYWQQLWQRLS